MIRFKYQLPGSFNAYDVYANSEKEALKVIRKTWKLSYYMTKKVAIWVTQWQNVDDEIAMKKAHLKEVLQANPHLCLTDFD